MKRVAPTGALLQFITGLKGDRHRGFARHPPNSSLPRQVSDIDSNCTGCCTDDLWYRRSRDVTVEEGENEVAGHLRVNSALTKRVSDPLLLAIYVLMTTIGLSAG